MLACIHFPCRDRILVLCCQFGLGHSKNILQAPFCLYFYDLENDVSHDEIHLNFSNDTPNYSCAGGKNPKLPKVLQCSKSRLTNDYSKSFKRTEGVL